MNAGPVVVLGASGMLGRVVSLHLLESGRAVIPVARLETGSAELDRSLVRRDLEPPGNVAALVREATPSAVVNCAVVKVTTDPARLEAINARLPHLLASLLDAARPAGKLVQISTDGVFLGAREGGGYTERDTPDAEDLYGTSKRRGEVTRAPHVTVRTSIVGEDPRKRQGLVEWLRGATEAVRGYTGAAWSGVTTLELARFVERLLRDDVSGLVHLAGPRISKAELLRTIADVYGLDVPITPEDGPRRDLSLASVREDVAWKTPSTREMLDELAAWEKAHRA